MKKYALASLCALLLGVTVVAQSSYPVATFVAQDDRAKGTWMGSYGAQGYHIFTDGTALPSYVTSLTSNGLEYIWAANTTDVRALQCVGCFPGPRRAATRFSNFPFYVDIDFNDNELHRVSVYFVDYDSTTRAQVVEVRDLATNVLLTSHVVERFTGGKWLIWDIAGDVRFVIKPIAGANGVVSGFFFQP